MAKKISDNADETPIKKPVRSNRAPRARKPKADASEAPAQESSPRIEMTTAEAPTSYDWSPADRGRQQQDAGDDMPTSFRASPQDAPERAEEPTEPSGESREEGHEQSSSENAPGASEGQGQTAEPYYTQQGQQQRQGGQWRENRWSRQGGREQGGRGGRFDRFNKQRGNRDNRHGNQQGGRFDRRDNPPQQQPRQSQQTAEPTTLRNERLENLPQWEILSDLQALETKAMEIAHKGEIFNYTELLGLHTNELLERLKTSHGLEWSGAPLRDGLLTKALEIAFAQGYAIQAEGVVELVGGEAIVLFGEENYRVRANSPYLPKALVERYAIKMGSIVKLQLHPAREGSKMPIALKVYAIMGEAPEKNLEVTPFEELTPYYPTKRILLETSPDVKWDNFSMRITDLLTPVGFGQRGLIVAPPRTGKTILMQGMANAIAQNHPDAHLIVLLVDERPEEVTDFKRQVKGEVVSSTFDETAQSHTHCAEIVIEKARRMVEKGRHVVILLDSITRLARAYNALTGNSGKIMSGGVESNALQKPKRFFGSARNIEGGGSLTILGTALVDTGSKMDEVIFEEFKGTGNMELHLDRGLVDKRLFPAIALDKSGTRKEELLYHPDETLKVYGLRRAMKGVPPLEAMEMLLTRVKKTKTNIEFLMGLSR